MSEELLFLPHTLSLHGPVNEPLSGFSDGLLEEDSGRFETVLAYLMGRLEPSELVQRMQMRDGWPLPQAVDWVPWSEAEWLEGLSTADKRLYRIFEQLVHEHRKSGKYFAAFQTMCQHYPREPFLQLLMAYRFEWEPPESVQLDCRKLLAVHPGWLNLRLLLARSYLKEDQLDFNAFLEVMQQKVNLHEHQPEKPFTDLLVYQFHLDMYLFFTLKGHLERAAYCFNLCSRTATQPGILDSLAPLVLAALEQGPDDPAFKAFLKFLKD